MNYSNVNVTNFQNNVSISVCLAKYQKTQFPKGAFIISQYT